MTAAGPYVAGLDPAWAGPCGVALVEVSRDDVLWADAQLREGPSYPGAWFLSPHLTLYVESDGYRSRAWHLGKATGWWICHLRPEAVVEVRTTEWRKWAYGYLPDREEAKELAVQLVQLHYNLKLAHDAAEAVMLMSYGRAQLRPGAWRPSREQVQEALRRAQEALLARAEEKLLRRRGKAKAGRTGGARGRRKKSAGR